MEKEKSGCFVTGFLEVLTLIFVVAKLGHFIDWSWWLVFSPMIGLGAVILALLVVLGIGYLIENK